MQKLSFRRRVFRLANAPTGLSATNQCGGSILLQWTNTDSAAETILYRNGVEIATKAPGVTSHTTTQSVGTHHYTAKHFKANRLSVASNQASVQTGPLPAGSGSIASVVGGNGSFTVTWSRPDAYSTITLYASYNDAAYQAVGSYGPAETSDTLTGFGENVKGKFYVVATNDCFSSGNSSVVTGWTSDFITGPPTNLQSTPSYTSASLSWTNGDASCPTVLRVFKSGNQVWTATAAAGATSHSGPTGLQLGTQYTWKAVHTKTDNNGVYRESESAVANFTTLTLPTPSPTIAHTGGGNLSLTWAASGVAGSTYFWAIYTDGVLRASGQTTGLSASYGTAPPETPNCYGTVYYTAQGGTSSTGTSNILTTPEGPELLTLSSSVSGTDLTFSWLFRGVGAKTYDYTIKRDTTTLESVTGGTANSDTIPLTVFGMYTITITAYLNGYSSGPHTTSYNYAENPPADPTIDAWEASYCDSGDPVYQVGVAASTSTTGALVQILEGTPPTGSLVAEATQSVSVNLPSTGQFDSRGPFWARALKNGQESGAVTHPEQATDTNPCGSS